MISDSMSCDAREAAQELPASDCLTVDRHEPHDAVAGGAIFNSKRVISNILSLASGEAIARLVAFFGTAYLARELGVTGFGIIGFAAVLFGYLSLTVSAGFNDVGSREVACRPHQASAIAASVILVKLALASVAFIVLGVVTWFLDKPPTVKLVIILMGLSLLSLAIDASWVHKGLQQSYLIGLALVSGQVLYVATIFVVVKKPEDVIYVPLAQFFGEMSAALLLLIPLFRLGGMKADLREGLKILRSSGFLAVSRLLRMFIYTFDVLLLGLLLGEREVGLYAAPYRICFLLVAIAVAIHSSYLPEMTRAMKHGVRQVGHIAERSMHLAVAVAAPMIVGGIIISIPLLQAVFGVEYTEGAAAFRLLLLSIGFVFIHAAIHNVLLVCNRLKVEMYIFAFAAGLNIVLNLILIPLYGLFGAALVTALAEGIILLSGLLVLYKNNIRLNLLPLLRPLIASGVMGASLLALGSKQGLLLYLAVGFIVYVLVLAALRGVPQDVEPHLRILTSFAGGQRRWL